MNKERNPQVEEEEGSEGRFGIALLNGGVLSLIGLLVLATLFVTDLTESQRNLDLMAGSIMLISGIFLLYWHYKS